MQVADEGLGGRRSAQHGRPIRAIRTPLESVELQQPSAARAVVLGTGSPHSGLPAQMSKLGDASVRLLCRAPADAGDDAKQGGGWRGPRIHGAQLWWPARSGRGAAVLWSGGAAGPPVLPPAIGRADGGKWQRMYNYHFTARSPHVGASLRAAARAARPFSRSHSLQPVNSVLYNSMHIFKNLQAVKARFRPRFGGGPVVDTQPGCQINLAASQKQGWRHPDCPQKWTRCPPFREGIVANG